MKQKEISPITDKDFIEALEALIEGANILHKLGYDEDTISAIEEKKLQLTN